MSQIKNQIEQFRAALLPPESIDSEAECLTAVNRLGFVWPFSPGNGLLPALFPALKASGEHQRWDWMWRWKDRLSASRQAYYGKVVGHKPTFSSHEWLPRFYALTGNTGDLDDDMVHVAEQGRLSEPARKVVAYLREQGPTGTRTLIAKLTDGSRPMKTALEKGLAQLDTAMLIAKCGTEGGNSIANVWDLFPRFLPEAVDQGTEIPTREAAYLLLRRYFDLTPAVARQALVGLFPWNEAHQHKAIARLLEAGDLVEFTYEGKSWLRRHDFIPALPLNRPL